MSEFQNYFLTNPPIRETVVGYLIKDDEVLLGVRTRVSNSLGHMIVAGIGGGIEDGESPEEALVREVSEEVNVTITDYEKVGYVTNLVPHRPVWNQRIAVYVVTGFEGEPKKTEEIDPHWYPKHSLPLQDMWADNRVTVPMILSGERVEGRFLYGPDGQILEQNVRKLGR